MTTDMPEVIYAGDYDEETLSVTAYDHAVGNYQKYIRADKHEELKAIAEKMLNAINNAGCYCWFDGDTLIEECKRCEVKTEYNKYKEE